MEPRFGSAAALHRSWSVAHGSSAPLSSRAAIRTGCPTASPVRVPASSSWVVFAVSAGGGCVAGTATASRLAPTYAPRGASVTKFGGAPVVPLGTARTCAAAGIWLATPTAGAVPDAGAAGGSVEIPAGAAPAREPTRGGHARGGGRRAVRGGGGRPVPARPGSRRRRCRQATAPSPRRRPARLASARRRSPRRRRPARASPDGLHARHGRAQVVDERRHRGRVRRERVTQRVVEQIDRGALARGGQERLLGDTRLIEGGHLRERRPGVAQRGDPVLVPHLQLLERPRGGIRQLLADEPEQQVRARVSVVDAAVADRGQRRGGERPHAGPRIV